MKILTIDGGGIWGFGVAQAIEIWENEFGVRFADLFDGFAGTSTGSIIASALAVGMTGAEIRELYEEHAKAIFSKPPLWWKLSPWRPKYDGRGLEDTLEMCFGKKRFKDCLKPLFITSSDSHGANKNKVFDNVGDTHTPLAFAVRCSASAPTYFPPVDGRYMDGGLWANNPSMVAFTGLVRLGIPENSIRILSIGTNGVNPDGRKIPTRMTLLDWSKYLMGDFMFSGGESAVAFYLEQLAKGRVQRVEPIVKAKIDLDDIGRMAEISEIWKREAQAQASKVHTFILEN